MTLASRLRALTRTVAGAALGIGLVAGLLAAAPPAALAQSSAAAGVAGDGPALWVVRDADSTIYLFGTVHVLRPETVWLSPRVEAAFDSAPTVYFEISNPGDQAAMIPLVQRHGLSPDQPLSHRVGSGDLTLLDAAARTVGLTALQMDPMKPWSAALILSVSPLVAAGYDLDSGVEIVLRARAVEAGKTVAGLETMAEQVGFLAGFSEAAQLAFLRSVLEAYEDAPVELDQLVEAWARGDISRIETLGVEETRATGPEVYRVLLADRNAAWAGRIDELLDGSGVIFIAVGAAHLAGPDSVQVQLEKRGIQVETESPPFAKASSRAWTCAHSPVNAAIAGSLVAK